MTTHPANIGRYKVEGVLGRGGMGVVYQAREPSTNDLVAIKVLTRQDADNPQLLSRLRREARILGSLESPTLARVYGMETSAEGQAFLVMEYVEGETLADRCRRGPIPFDELLPLVRDVALALRSAHQQGVVHRDLKPHNVMIQSNGRAKVLDFGLAKEVAKTHYDPGHESPDTTSIEAVSLQTGEGVIVGTPGYMSPEQIRGEDLDARADIFAFGVLLLEGLTGRKVFPGRRPGEILANTLTEPPSFDHLPGDARGELKDLLTICLEKDRDHRVDSIDPVLEQIDAWLAADPESGETPIVGLPELPSSLPTLHSSFVGRKGELQRCQAELRRVPLLTLVGAAGCGKTRLAIELVHRLRFQPRDAIHFIELAPVGSPDGLSRAIAESLGVRDEPGQSVEQQIDTRLGSGRTLLVLDNCEHLLEDCAEFVAGLVDRCPDLQVLATSRVRMGLACEQVVAVDPLSVSNADTGTEPEAVQLFAERARSVQPLFRINEGNRAAIAEICRSLDGIPLAIELAAAWTRVLSPQEILVRLSERFRLLRRHDRSLNHHATLEEAIRWSYEHLAEEEKSLFRSVSIFAGSFGVDGALALAGFDVDEYEALESIERLVGKSMIVVRNVEENARYELLESLRHFGQQELQSLGERKTAEHRLCQYYAALAAKSKIPLEGAEQDTWLSRWDQEYVNARIAIEVAAKSDDLGETCLAICVGIWRFWLKRGYFEEGLDQVSKAVERSQGTGADRALLGEALNAIGTFAGALARYDHAIESYQRSAEFFEEAGQKAGLVIAMANLATPLVRIGDLDRAHAVLVEALEASRAVGEDYYTTSIAANLGAIEVVNGRFDKARELFEEAVLRFRQIGDPHGTRLALTNLAYVLENLGRREEARAHYDESIELMKQHEDRRGIVSVLAKIICMEAEGGEIGRVRGLLKECLEMVDKVQDRQAQINSIEASAIFASAIGDHRRAAEMTAAASSRREDWGFAYEPLERTRIDSATESAREALGDAEFELATRLGKNMELETALTVAGQLLDHSGK